MDTKGISVPRILTEIKEHNYPVPPIPVLKENLRQLETRLRLLLDERFDAHGNVLSTYEAIAQKEGVSTERARQLIEKAIWILAGKPKGEYDGDDVDLKIY